MSIPDNLKHVLSSVPPQAALVAVSKFHNIEQILEAYSAGQRHFGESRVQELAVKVPSLPADIRWHFIGHLQTNKVRQLLRLHPALIESIDSERLLWAVDAEAAAQGIAVRVLMQVHVAAEDTKFGFSPENLVEFFARRGYERLKAVHICGVMGMATNTDDIERISSDFTTIRQTFDKICSLCPDLRGFDTVSMGMSDDFPIALQCGSNMVRVGTAIFGERT